jgi:hypothetical protein
MRRQPPRSLACPGSGTGGCIPEEPLIQNCLLLPIRGGNDEIIFPGIQNWYQFHGILYQLFPDSVISAPVFSLREELAFVLNAFVRIRLADRIAGQAAEGAEGRNRVLRIAPRRLPESRFRPATVRAMSQTPCMTRERENTLARHDLPRSRRRTAVCSGPDSRFFLFIPSGIRGVRETRYIRA